MGGAEHRRRNRTTETEVGAQKPEHLPSAHLNVSQDLAPFVFICGHAPLTFRFPASSNLFFCTGKESLYGCSCCTIGCLYNQNRIISTRTCGP